MGTIAKVINNNAPFYLLCMMKLSSACMVMGGVAILFSMQLSAGDWKIAPHMAVKGTYSDNADLSNTDKKSQFYTQVTPAVAIQREGGGRVQLELNYELDYTKNRPGNRGRPIAHFLDSDMQAELFKNVLFLDASIGAYLSSLTSGGQRGRDSVGDVSDPVQTYVYTLSPYFKHHVGQYFDILTRYTFDQVLYSGKGGSGSKNNQVLVAINSGTHFSRLGWGISSRHSKTNNRDGAKDSDTTSINGNVSYLIDRKWRINLGGGKIDYDIQSSHSSTDGFTWNAGATWTPNPRTVMGFSYGRQFYGENVEFSLNHKWRRSTWHASYKRELTDSRTQQTIRANTATGHSDYKGDFDYASLTDEYYVLETFNTGYSVVTRRSNLSMSAHYTRREYEVSRDKDRDMGIYAGWDRRLTPKSNAIIGLSWQKNRADDNATEDTRWSINLGLKRMLTKKTSANIDYKHSRLDSTERAGEYRENQISLSLASKW